MHHLISRPPLRSLVVVIHTTPLTFPSSFSRSFATEKTNVVKRKTNVVKKKTNVVTKKTNVVTKKTDVVTANVVTANVVTANVVTDKADAVEKPNALDKSHPVRVLKVRNITALISKEFRALFRKKDQIDLSWELYQKLSQHRKKKMKKNFTPHIYNLLIKRYSEKGQLRKALHLLRYVQAKDIHTVNSYNPILSAFSQDQKKKDLATSIKAKNQVLGLYIEMKKNGEKYQENPIYAPSQEKEKEKEPEPPEKKGITGRIKNRIKKVFAAQMKPMKKNFLKNNDKK